MMGLEERDSEHAWAEASASFGSDLKTIQMDARLFLNAKNQILKWQISLNPTEWNVIEKKQKKKNSCKTFPWQSVLEDAKPDVEQLHRGLMGTGDISHLFTSPSPMWHQLARAADMDSKCH